MLKLASDENLNNSIVRGLLRRKPDLDIVCIQDAGLTGADYPGAFEWAAQENRVLLTHDVATMAPDYELVLRICANDFERVRNRPV